jgi:cell filamentation protein
MPLLQKSKSASLKEMPITDQIELAKAEEKISKQKARQLFDSGDLHKVEVGKFAGLAFIHAYLFEDIYPFAGKIRHVNIAKGDFSFVPLMYLEPSLKHIDAMPQSTFDQIIEKYVEMNIAHPFREGNGRATRIWLDLMLKKEIQQVVDWNQVDKEEYLSAMQRSVVKDLEIKVLLKQAVTNQIDDRALFMKGIDVSYYYEGYNEFKTEDL